MADITGHDDLSVSPVKMQPRVPNRKKFEEEQASCQSIIKCKESDCKVLLQKLDEKLQPELETLRASKLSLNQRRQSINNDLSKINQEICKQEAELGRVQSSLQYRNENKINEAIQRLETQLQTRNFTLAEEKKIVSEIDSLKRSKRNLGTYMSVKKQTDEKRDSARHLRDQRDELFKELKEVRNCEDRLKSEFHCIQDLINKNKQEINEQQKKLLTLKKEFADQEKWYNEWRRRHSAQVQKTKVEERKAAVEAHQLAEIEATSDTFASEKQLCTTLVNYLKQFHAPDDYMNQLMMSSLPASGVHCLQDTSRSFEAEGMIRLQRKSDDEELYVNCMKPKTTKKLKKDKRKTLSRKPIVTPEIIAQFAQLGLRAPLSVAEVPTAIEQLMSYLARISLLQSVSKDQLITGEVVQSAIAETVPSSAASYTGSSVPTTPDMQTDVAPGLMLSSCDSPISVAGSGELTCAAVGGSYLCPAGARPDLLKRRLSHDSGACELDDVGNSCVEFGL